LAKRRPPQPMWPMTTAGGPLRWLRLSSTAATCVPVRTCRSVASRWRCGVAARRPSVMYRTMAMCEGRCSARSQTNVMSHPSAAMRWTRWPNCPGKCRWTKTARIAPSGDARFARPEGVGPGVLEPAQGAERDLEFAQLRVVPHHQAVVSLVDAADQLAELPALVREADASGAAVTRGGVALDIAGFDQPL